MSYFGYFKPRFAYSRILWSDMIIDRFGIFISEV